METKPRTAGRQIKLRSTFKFSREQNNASLRNDALLNRGAIEATAVDMVSAVVKNSTSASKVQKEAWKTSKHSYCTQILIQRRVVEFIGNQP